MKTTSYIKVKSNVALCDEKFRANIPLTGKKFHLLFCELFAFGTKQYLSLKKNNNNVCIR